MRFTRVDFCFPAKISVFPPKIIFKFYRVHLIPLSCPLAVKHRTNFHRPKKLFWHRSCKLKRRKYPEFHFRRNGLRIALPQLKVPSIFAHYLDATDLNNKIGLYCLLFLHFQPTIQTSLCLSMWLIFHDQPLFLAFSW